MFFLNLSAGEFLTLLGALGGLTAALYLLDRTKRRRVVSTLRFWTPAATAHDRQNRRRVREPWSLVLQLVSLTLLLLAVAQLELGSRERRGRDHVVLLDTSAWTAQRSGQTTLLAREKRMTERYVAALPLRDRVMLVRADALATPATPFTSDRKQIASTIEGSTPGFSALNMAQALVFAQQAQNWSPDERGEIVYIGPGMIAGSETALPKLENLRTILIPPDREHVGIRGVGVRRSEADENAWQASVVVKNYGIERAIVRLQVQYAGTTFTPRAMTLIGGEESAAEYEFETRAAGELIAQIKPGDGLVSDQHVALELPRTATLRVAVVTDRPEMLKPLFATNRRLIVRFFASFDREAENWADLAVFDRTAPTTAPKVASIWIDPPKERSPLPVKGAVSDAEIANWNPETPLSAGLHAKDRHIASAEVFQAFDGDIAVASVAEGPIVMARNADATHGKMAVIGFDPLASELRFQVTTPLLFANLLHWFSPDVFRPAEASAERVGAVMVTLDASERAEGMRVLDERGSIVPFFAHKESLQLFAQKPEVLRVISQERERVLSITVPDVAPFEWKPPVRAASGIPAMSRVGPGAVDLWQFLALLAGLGLFAEWMLFGRRRVSMRRAEAGRPANAVQQERELVAK